jgi:ABC-2 type transport system ATP-binding protein
MGGRRGGGIPSFTNIIKAIQGTKGPFIEALGGLNLKIKDGEVFGILGPNGAGKTTLIKILCTLVLHDEGEAFVKGIDVSREPGRVLDNLQAVLPGSRGFTWRLSGRQNLEFYALLYGLEDDEANDRIDYLLELTGLSERGDDGYQRYSTGMQRKLLLCRGLLRDTPILLFDEPTTGLDPRSAAEFRSLLREKLVVGEGKTILMSTHNLSEAQEMCDRIAILDRGKITALDTPDNIRYNMVEESHFNVGLSPVEYTPELVSMVDGLEQISGVIGVTPDVDPTRGLLGLSFRVEKEMDLSPLLELLMSKGLWLRSLNTTEPTLEDAFIAMTGRYPGMPQRRRGRRR